VSALLEDLSLTSCAATPIGSIEKRGLSGGQRKRVSVVSRQCIHHQVKRTGYDGVPSSPSCVDIVSEARTSPVPGIVTGARTLRLFAPYGFVETRDWYPHVGGDVKT
jgi:hypothetical protein